jgi:hypothetical protein
MTESGNPKLAAEAASAIDRAVEELLNAAQTLQAAGWGSALGKGEGHPLEFWGVDDGLEEVAGRLKGIADRIRGTQKSTT